MAIRGTSRTLATLLLALSVTACTGIDDTAGEPPRAADRLIGCYEQGDRPGPSLRVSASAGDYRVQSIGSASPVVIDRTMVEPKPEQLAALMADKGESIEAMIMVTEGAVFLVKFQPGTAVEGMVSETGHYLGIPPLGGQPLRPVPCPD